jgi:hypothetical protein
MKTLKLTGVIGAVAIALILFVTACSKNNNTSSGTKLGTMTYTANDTIVTLPAVLDTSLNFVVYSVGPLPGTKDTVTFTLTLLTNQSGQPISQLSGLYTDTSFSTTDLSVSYLDPGTSSFYTDNVGNSIFLEDITSKKNGVVTATFNGIVYLQSGNGADSIVIKNGSFSVQL